MSVLKLRFEGSFDLFLSNLSLNWACSQQKAYLMVAAEPSHVLNGGPMVSALCSHVSLAMSVVLRRQLRNPKKSYSI